MFIRVSAKRKQQVLEQKTEALNAHLSSLKVASSIKENIKIMQTLFADDDTFIERRVTGPNGVRYYITYCDGLVDSQVINEHLIQPLMQASFKARRAVDLDQLLRQVVQIGEVKKVKEFKTIVESITYGDTILFVDGMEQAAILNTKSFTLRAVNEPETEKLLSGPREGFTEAVMINLSMLKRRLRTNELKLKFKTFGERSNTTICICYLDGVVDKQVLGELYRRLEGIQIDGILDQNYLTELIRDAPYSFFRTTGYTERPDVVASKLLEGRIAILVDGSPVALTVPYLFIENFQTPEDYYLSFFYTSLTRMLRMLAFFLTISVPAIYVAVVAFHHEILPYQLIINLTAERATVPLPASLEALVMVLVFDILRETGLRMPTYGGQALSIVGALVIGQSAVEAKLIAADMIIVVGLTGITNILVPKLNSSIEILRFSLLLLGSVFGLYGVILGYSILLIQLLNLESFGKPSLSDIEHFDLQHIKDYFFRVSWTNMITRPAHLSPNRVRLKGKGSQ